MRKIGWYWSNPVVYWQGPQTKTASSQPHLPDEPSMGTGNSLFYTLLFFYYPSIHPSVCLSVCLSISLSATLYCLLSSLPVLCNGCHIFSPDFKWLDLTWLDFCVCCFCSSRFAAFVCCAESERNKLRGRDRERDIQSRTLFDPFCFILSLIQRFISCWPSAFFSNKMKAYIHRYTCICD